MKQLTVLILLCCSMMSHANNLNTTSSIKLLTVNGQPHNKFDSDHELGAGDIVLGLRYEELFEVSMEEHHIIRSSIYYLKFSSDATRNYFISTPQVNENDAKQFAVKPKFILKDESGKEISYKIWSREDLLHKLMDSH